MKATQQHVLDVLNMMPLADVADLAFSTAVSKILLDRSVEFKKSAQYKSALRPFGSTNVRVTPNSQIGQVTTTTPFKTLTPKAAPAHVTTLAKRTMTVAQREALAAVWAKTNVNAGSIVKMNGTRDGHGIRYVEAVVGDTVKCRTYTAVSPGQVHAHNMNKVIRVSENGQTMLYVFNGTFSNHQIGKVAALLQPAGITGVLVAKQAP